MAARIDYEAEGLLEGLEGQARAERVELLDRLVAEGAELDEITEAVEDGRLFLLGVERAVTGERRYSQHEIAELAGVPIEVLEAQRRALGLAVGSREAREHSEEDLEAAKRVKVFLEAGLDRRMLDEVARVMAITMSQLAAAHREVIRDLLDVEDGAEPALARGLEELARKLLPLTGPTLDYVYRQQLREQLRHAATDAEPSGEAEEEATGRPTAVAFADLVGFTKLGERLPPEELGGITGRLGELAAAVATGPVRLIKLIGDGAMFSSGDPEALVEAVLELVEDVADEGEELPELRAGVALGPVVSRGGDLYGSTVNLASRITGVARPGSALVTADVKGALDGSFRFSFAGQKRLKGIAAPVELFRCRWAEDAEEAEGEDGDAGEPEERRPGRKDRRSRRRRRARAS